MWLCLKPAQEVLASSFHRISIRLPCSPSCSDRSAKWGESCRNLFSLMSCNTRNTEHQPPPHLTWALHLVDQSVLLVTTSLHCSFDGCFPWRRFCCRKETDSSPVPQYWAKAYENEPKLNQDLSSGRWGRTAGQGPPTSGGKQLAGRSTLLSLVEFSRISLRT